MKFCVVPEESDRTAMVIAVLGRLDAGVVRRDRRVVPVVILPWKMPAMTGADSFRLLTPDRLYDTVIGPITTGK